MHCSLSLADKASGSGNAACLLQQILTVVCVTAQSLATLKSARHTYSASGMRTAHQASVQHSKHAYGTSEHVSHQLFADAVMQQGGPVPSAFDVEHDEFV